MKKPKFELRQTVYVWQSGYKRSRTKCPICKGKGEVTIRETGQCITCFKCGGRGILTREVHTYKAMPAVIVGVRIEEYLVTARSRKTRMECCYMLRGNSWYSAETTIYATKEEVQAAIAKHEAELEAARSAADAEYNLRRPKKATKRRHDLRSRR